ncbi:MAG TPA: bifunctional aspartate kinase/homoserine dehydrogenase I [Gemmatimonadaceae bacterium]|jgi:aspartokinase/homoserine dehydrogenase 1|nr:bifunctional aspartate kinase/homoserine dehydrogenase I [Gemmatimonadaceae bacterium]
MTGDETTCVVHKFGGTSLADANCFRQVAEIVAARPEQRRLIVVSAMAGVTDQLVSAVHVAGKRDFAYRDIIEAVGARHRETIAELFPADVAEPLCKVLTRDLAIVEEVLHVTTVLHGYSRNGLELVSGYGEVWSAQILAALLHEDYDDVDWLDAREVLRVTRTESGADVVWPESRERADAWVARRGALPSTTVITGFVASTEEGIAATLGRNGSDFSASIFASLFDAQEIHIWTDVNGVMSANPRLVSEAVTLETLSYDEAIELAYFGAKVIHPSTISTAVERNLPILIRNTFCPNHPGTRIQAASASTHHVKGLATVESVSLLNVEGIGMIGVRGIAQRLFSALRDEGVSVLMISQGSSGNSICFAVTSAQVEQARNTVERAFFAERLHGQIRRVDVTNNCSILAVVGEGMAGQPGVAAKFFSALGKAGISLRAIAQGSSERNISVVVDAADTQRALRAAHSGFYLSDQTLSIGLVGAGNVGATLLRQMSHRLRRLKQEFDVDLRVRGIATSRRMLLSDRPIDLDHWQEELAAHGEPTDLARFAEHVHGDHLPHAVLIDCTASDAVSGLYSTWLESGIHVITPNKRGNTSSLEYYRRLRQANRTVGAHYLYETTVGAALPIISTLRDLVQTGDEIVEIEGIFSGTLSYLFNSFDGTRSFSALVARARELGYTEPDPRDDLSGMDVARKVVILAREMGMTVELGDVRLEGLVPEELTQGPVSDFLAALPRYDGSMERLRQEAAAKGEVLRFVGRVDHEGNASVALRSYHTTHPFARIQLTDNIVLFRTSRYNENPLVVQGPGAGREVTAAGVFADLLRLASYLGATL